MATSEVTRIRMAHPTALASVRERHPGLVVRAAAARNTDAMRLLLELGFDLNAKARADLPIDQERETALHVAAGDGDAELMELLLALGADRTMTDTRFGATPGDWADHHGHSALAEHLRLPARRST